jgi:lipopolysaccharide export LptBFGC system permease protein LptF
MWRYIGLEILAILVVAIVAQILMNVGIAAFQLVQDDGLRLAYIWPFLLKMSTLSLYYTVPISLLFAATLGLGRMVADLEITALKASGFSYAQIGMPAIGLGIVLSLIANHLNGEVIPPISFERRNLTKMFLRQLTNLGYGGERTITLPKGLGTIRCERYYGNTLENVTITTWSLEKLSGTREEEAQAKRLNHPFTIRARIARIETVREESGEEKLLVRLDDAHVTVPHSFIQSGVDNQFFQQFQVLQLPLPISLTESQPRLKERPSSALRTLRRENGVLRARLEVEREREKDVDARRALERSIQESRSTDLDIALQLGRRRAFAFSCLSFLWAAVPLTLWLNSRNRLVPFFLGNMGAIGIFYPLVTLGALLGRKGYPAELVLQSGNIALFLVGSIMLWRLRKC